MSNKVVLAIVALLLLLVFVFLFIAGYERGIYKARLSSETSVQQNIGVAGVAGAESAVGSAAVRSAEAIILPDKGKIVGGETVAVALLGDRNEATDEINFEFNRSRPLIVSNHDGDDYTIDSLADGLLNGESGSVNVNAVENIKSEIFVYVGIFNESKAVLTVEFLIKMGYKARIMHKAFGKSVYSFVIAGPFFLTDDAQKFCKYIKSKGYKFAKLIY